MSNIKANEICENCKHFFNEHGHTQCRKYAPRRGDGGKSWANVEKIDWCSEFEGTPPPVEAI